MTHVPRPPMGLLGGNLYSEDAGIALEQQVFRPRGSPPLGLSAGANIAITNLLGTQQIAATFTAPPAASPNASYLTLDKVPYNALQRQLMLDKNAFDVYDAGPGKFLLVQAKPLGGDLGGTLPNPTVIPENTNLLNAVRAFLAKPIPAKTLLAGSNVTLTDNGLTITIASTASGSEAAANPVLRNERFI